MAKKNFKKRPEGRPALQPSGTGRVEKPKGRTGPERTKTPETGAWWDDDDFFEPSTAKPTPKLDPVMKRTVQRDQKSDKKMKGPVFDDDDFFVTEKSPSKKDEEMLQRKKTKKNKKDMQIANAALNPYIESFVTPVSRMKVHFMNYLELANKLSVKDIFPEFVANSQEKMAMNALVTIFSECKTHLLPTSIANKFYFRDKIIQKAGSSTTKLAKASDVKDLCQQLILSMSALDKLMELKDNGVPGNVAQKHKDLFPSKKMLTSVDGGVNKGIVTIRQEGIVSMLLEMLKFNEEFDINIVKLAREQAAKGTLLEALVDSAVIKFLCTSGILE